MTVAAPVERLEVHAYTIPTDEPESDGTLEWDSTTIVVVEAHAGEKTGLGYTYCDAAAAEVVSSQLAGVVEGEDVMDVRAAWLRMTAQVRNSGQPGIGFCAVSAVDQALWDLKARLLGVPLVVLLGAAHEDVPIYGSGGFCSYTDERLCEQLGGWAEAGIPRVKMKVGREPERDPVRLDHAREAIGDDVELYVDANGAFARKEALAWAERYADAWNVTWFEEPVSSDDLQGLRLIRDSGPAGLVIAAGEYAYVPGRLPGPRRLRRLPPGRRDALRRDHRSPLRVRPRERALDRHLRPLRAGDLDACLLRRRAAPAPRVLPRPRPDRGDGVRRRSRARGRRPAARSLAAGQRARAQAP